MGAQDIISANWVVPNRSARLGDDIQTSRFIILLRYAQGKHWKALIVKNLFDLQNLSDGYVKVMQWLANFLNIVRGSKDKIAFRCVDFLGWWFKTVNERIPESEDKIKAAPK